jgi:hypothetical protein
MLRKMSSTTELCFFFGEGVLADRQLCGGMVVKAKVQIIGYQLRGKILIKNQPNYSFSGFVRSSNVAFAKIVIKLAPPL